MTVWTPRAKGHAPSAPDFHPSRPAMPDHVVGVGAALPDTALGLRQYMTAIRNQGFAEACEGFTWARAAHLRAAAQGTPIPYPSEYSIWTLGRGNGEGMQNVGVSTEAVASAMMRFGIVSEQRMPFPEDWTERLPLDVFQHGADAQVTGLYGIHGSGATRVLQMRQALAAGYPVPFAMSVDQQYEAGGFGVFAGLTSASLGNHMQLALGYAPKDGGGYKFLVPGSWGADWNEAGYAWISDDFMGSDQVFDVYGVDASPAGVS